MSSMHWTRSTAHILIIAVALACLYQEAIGFNFHGHSTLLKHSSSRLAAVSGADDPLLVRAYQGRDVERIPIWLMRQTGLHFDKSKVSPDVSYLNVITTPEAAIDMSLSPWRQFGFDGVIPITDILAPLPAMGIDVYLRYRGAPIVNTDVLSTFFKTVRPIHNPRLQLPYVEPTFLTLKSVIHDDSALIGTCGGPWSILTNVLERNISGKKFINKLCYQTPNLARRAMELFTDSMIEYALFQIEMGAQIFQIFDPLTGVATPNLFDEFCLPYIFKMISVINNRFPNVPIVYYSYATHSYLPALAQLPENVALNLDWSVSLESAREIVGNNRVLAGNLDPSVLMTGSEEVIRSRARDILKRSGGKKFVFNLGSNLCNRTPLEAAAILVDEVRNFDFAKQ